MSAKPVSTKLLARTSNDSSCAELLQHIWQQGTAQSGEAVTKTTWGAARADHRAAGHRISPEGGLLNLAVQLERLLPPLA